MAPADSIHLFFAGDAEIGKTFTLMLLIQGLFWHYAKYIETNVDTPLALVMAYTGKATFNVGGTTVHSALHLLDNKAHKQASLQIS